MGLLFHPDSLNKHYLIYLLVVLPDHYSFINNYLSVPRFKKKKTTTTENTRINPPWDR